MHSTSKRTGLESVDVCMYVCMYVHMQALWCVDRTQIPTFGVFVHIDRTQIPTFGVFVHIDRTQIPLFGVFVHIEWTQIPTLGVFIYTLIGLRYRRLEYSYTR